MAVRKNVLQEDDILCELYADRSSDVSDFSDSESLDSDIERDSDIPHWPHNFHTHFSSHNE